MNRRSGFPVAVALIVVAFGVGWWIGRSAGTSPNPEREILYYVDPMNPAFRSDEPGMAPCGMPLEPVYAGDTVGDVAIPSPSAIAVRADRLHLMGIETETLALAPVSHVVQLRGRVAADETRVHAVDTDVNGWVRKAGPFTSGSQVRKGEVLGAFYSEDLIAPQQNLVNALRALDGLAGKEDPESQKQALIQEQLVRTARRSLLDRGMSEAQLEEVERQRTVATEIEVRAPSTGQVLERDFQLGQHFAPMTALFVIADVERVWVLADVFHADRPSFERGAEVTIEGPGRDHAFSGRVARVPAEVEAESGTVKVRIEVDNPRHELLPGMFVTVERKVTLDGALSVPASAVLDTGQHQRVFVEVQDGVFEPREIVTGTRFGDRVLIRSGLEPGEAVVVAGNFLLDSESRMRTAPPSRTRAESTRDPVCGMAVDEAAARDAGRSIEYDDRTWHFCSEACKEKFEADPGAYAEQAGAP